MSSGSELLVIEMMGVDELNWRMIDVAETPSRFGIAMSCASPQHALLREDRGERTMKTRS